MENIPKIRLTFLLTKKDIADFDRESVTQRLHITPTDTAAPTLSKGKLISEANFCEIEKELPGITVLPATSPPYQMLKHAYWCVELPPIECWNLVEPLQQLEQLLTGKKSELLCMCKEYNLSASTVVCVYAETSNMPELIIPNKSLSFFSSIDSSIVFDFYLD